MKKIIPTIIMLSVLCCFSACSNNSKKDDEINSGNFDTSNISSPDSNDKYVDIDLEESSVTLSDSEFLPDLRTNFPLGANSYEFNGYYIFTESLKIDLDTLSVSRNCEIIGCKHGTDKCQISENRKRQSIRSYDGGNYYIEKNKLYYEKDGEKVLVYTNNFETEFGKEAYDTPKMLSDIIIVDKSKLILSSYNFAFTLNPITKEASEPIEVGYSVILSKTMVTDDLMAVANINSEIFTVDFNTRECKKIRDNAIDVQSDGESLYYIAKDAGMSRLTKSDIDGSNEQILAEDALYFTVAENSIFYFECNKTDAYKIDLETGKKEKVYELDNSDGCQRELSRVIYYPGYENIFFVVYERKTSKCDYILINEKTNEAVYIESKL